MRAVKWSAVGLAVALVGCGCAGGPMTSYRLQQDAASLGSCAAEGQLLSQVAARGRAPAAYIATHASEVGADCGDLASVVASTTPQANTKQRRVTLLRLARRVEAMFEMLEQNPNDAAAAARLARAFSSIGNQATKLEQGG
jgi:ATP-dependent helicase YprA (DUF1998 family)